MTKIMRTKTIGGRPIKSIRVRAKFHTIPVNMPSRMHRRLKVARDGASSRNHNPRNLEHLWYVFWSIVASRIAGRINSMNIFVAPQFPVWRLWIDDEDPIEVAAIEFRDDSAMDTTDYYLMGGAEDGDEDEDEAELEEANTSLPSVVATDKSKNRGRITDFALICWDSDYLVSTGSTLDEESDDEEVLSEEAVPKYDDIVPVLIEIKRMPSRKYAHPHLTTEFVELMSTAKLHAGRQVSSGLLIHVLECQTKL